MATNESPAKSRPPEPVLLEVGLAEHFTEELFEVVDVVALPAMLAATLAEKLAATAPVNVASI
jgi:hypothetical protein